MLNALRRLKAIAGPDPPQARGVLPILPGIHWRGRIIQLPEYNICDIHGEMPTRRDQLLCGHEKRRQCWPQMAEVICWRICIR